MPRSKQASEQMRARSRAKILEAARRLFADQGYFSSKVAEIARR
jgi:AcrR family transcriptional regulator